MCRSGRSFSELVPFCFVMGEGLSMLYVVSEELRNIQTPPKMVASSKKPIVN